jgi:hypothetical protein
MWVGAGRRDTTATLSAPSPSTKRRRAARLPVRSGVLYRASGTARSTTAERVAEGAVRLHFATSDAMSEFRMGYRAVESHRAASPQRRAFHTSRSRSRAVDLGLRVACSGCLPATGQSMTTGEP